MRRAPGPAHPGPRPAPGPAPPRAPPLQDAPSLPLLHRVSHSQVWAFEGQGRVESGRRDSTALWMGRGPLEGALKAGHSGPSVASRGWRRISRVACDPEPGLRSYFALVSEEIGRGGQGLPNVERPGRGREGGLGSRGKGCLSGGGDRGTWPGRTAGPPQPPGRLVGIRKGRPSRPLPVPTGPSARQALWVPPTCPTWGGRLAVSPQGSAARPGDPVSPSPSPP